MYFGNDVLFIGFSDLGGGVTELEKDEKNFLFPRQAIKKGGEESFRGGMHICSPIFGEKNDGQFAAMPEHGGLRDVYWQPIDVSERLTDVEFFCKFRQFSYQLDYKVSYLLDENCLGVAVSVENKLANPVPFELAWRPYFFALGGAKIFFLRSKTRPIFVGQSYGQRIFKASEVIEIRLAGLGRVKMWLLEGFATGQICLETDWQRRYVCVEPLLSHPDNFNTSKGIFLEPGRPLVANLAMYFD